MANREEIATIIFKEIVKKKEKLKEQFHNPKNKIGYFFLDDLLPVDLVTLIFNKFPDVALMKQRKNLREFKYVAYQMDKYDVLLKDILFAFQDEKIVALIADICNLKDVSADKNLYAGGLSLMGENHFLNPHLDNSHDKDRNQWRVLNLLYYVTPNWELKNGGNLELWQEGVASGEPTVVESKFNRLVVMVTHQNSWHSVSKVLVNDIRCCVSNYYFSTEPALPLDTFHVTTFRGRPSEKIKDVFFKVDGVLRNNLRKVFKKGIRENPHQYKNN